MVKQSTDTTGRNLVPEGHYEAIINKIVRKEPKGFIIYEWDFEALVNDKAFYFKLGMFPSQMSELLRALGAIEVSQGRFEWDDEDYVGVTVEFNLAHIADKKGIIREQIADIKRLTPVGDKSATSPSQVQWDN